MDNDDFYKFVVELSSIDHNKRHLDETSEKLTNMIISNYKKNVLIAASKGYNKAYLCVYKTNTIINEKILIDSFIRMDDEMKTKFREYNLETVLDRINRKIKPFTASVSDSGNDIISIYVTWLKK